LVYIERKNIDKLRGSKNSRLNLKVKEGGVSEGRGSLKGYLN